MLENGLDWRLLWTFWTNGFRVGETSGCSWIA